MKAINLISLVIFKIDNALYKTFGFVSYFRKKSWVLKGKRLQQQLDYEHAKRDRLNYLWDTNYTTKQALALDKD